MLPKQKPYQPELFVGLDPEFVNHRQATALFGLSRSHLYLLAERGKIRSVSLRERGKTKGKRLFVTDSVRGYLNDNIVEVAL